ncbi:hypothetical protein HFP15_18360 [Amycolatopsis sp. K13G38]|uniref:Uncharacterized protein n=1 Tax=Amycolatopsis acididurans TaxID=2724524 RepID=A0ABX1J694_9PSEU|nr:hypothetical protein [Amycolatopsis acididurans]NKQ54851.1 hypothetical protein [Amycolatopsis acididurans]
MEAVRSGRRAIPEGDLELLERAGEAGFTGVAGGSRGSATGWHASLPERYFRCHCGVSHAAG